MIGLWFRRRRNIIIIYAFLLMLCGCGTGTNGLFLNLDRDGDGISDKLEQLLGTDPDNPDSDFDGISDGDELSAGTSPLSRDSDGDGIADGDDDTIDPPSRRSGSVSTGNDLEPNDTFIDAVVLDNIPANALTLQGRIDREGDVDVFDLGPLNAGDRLRIDLIRRDDRFRASVAVFDHNALFFSTGLDPFSNGGPDLSGLIHEIIRHDAPRYFLGVTHPHDDIALGGYQLNVTIERNRMLPTPGQQIIFLDFDGGVPDRPILDISFVAPFDAGDIDPVYADDTEVIKQSIIRNMKENFAGFNVIIRTSDDPPTEDRLSVLLFGSFSRKALGASEGIDPYNVDCCDDGVVFTESFTPSVFGFLPRSGALGEAIGNVAAHEIGHLLGLQHVNDTAALMDESSPAVHLLFSQEFLTAPLAESVFPIGQQDAPLLLEETVGIR